MKHISQKTKGEPDYILDADSCWLEVGEIALYIRKSGDGVAVDFTPLGDAERTLDSIIVEP